MTSSTIVERYASALADVVTAPASSLSPAAALSELRAFADLVRESPPLRTALDSPAVSPARKRAVIERLVQAMGTAGTIRNFLFVLSNHRRLSALQEIVESFDIQLDERLGFVRAAVTAAGELDAPQLESLTARLAQVTGKQIRMNFQVDPALIGGVVARVGSTVYDGSVRGQLDLLSKKLSVY